MERVLEILGGACVTLLSVFALVAATMLFVFGLASMNMATASHVAEAKPWFIGLAVWIAATPVPLFFGWVAYACKRSSLGLGLISAPLGLGVLYACLFGLFAT
jgi:hypothetical protein